MVWVGRIKGRRVAFNGRWYQVHEILHSQHGAGGLPLGWNAVAVFQSLESLEQRDDILNDQWLDVVKRGFCFEKLE